uniref:Uncharacterized protein n=1 Tax=Meloidogyne incognita TaxID=6306 RepID=A0A914LN53_MELIC
MSLFRFFHIRRSYIIKRITMLFRAMSLQFDFSFTFNFFMMPILIRSSARTFVGRMALRGMMNLKKSYDDVFYLAVQQH